jgi:hypothetical protein
MLNYKLFLFLLPNIIDNLFFIKHLVTELTKVL